MKLPEIQLQVDDSMPMGELLQQSNENLNPIRRSAHIGNMFGADLILAAAGMRMILVDANYGVKDVLHFPQLVVDEEKEAIDIACPQTLSLFNRTSDGTALNDACTESIATAFGNNKVEPDSKVIGDNLKLVEAIVGELLPAFAKTFSRRVDENGRPIEAFAGPTNIESVMLLGDNPESGMILPNEINILLDFLMEAVNYGTDSVTHISGPTMVNYVGKIMPTMNAMYQKLVDAGFELPEKLDVKLVPAAGARFVVGADQRAQLDDILAEMGELAVLEGEVATTTKQMSALQPKPTSNEFAVVRAPAKGLAAQIAGRLSALPQLQFIASPEKNTPTFTSQFTALRMGANGSPLSGLYVPDLVFERPLSEVTVLFNKLIKLGRR